jgi:hypothetical protein
MNALLSPDALDVVRQNDIYLYLQLVAVFTLVILLIERELANNIQHKFARAVWRVTVVGIAPLLFDFLLIIAWHVSYAR